MPIHMRMRKLRGPHMKKSMPFEPFRTHTQPVNLADLEQRFEAGAEVTLEAAAGERPGDAQGRPVKVLAKGELTKALTVHAHGFSARRARAHRGGRRHLHDHRGLGAAPPPGRARPSTRIGRSRPPGRRTGGAALAMLATILNAFTVADIRKKLAFTAAMLRSTGSARTSPCRASTPTAVNSIQKNFGGSNILGLLNLFSGGGLSRIAIFALGIMPYITASIILQLLRSWCRRWRSSQRRARSGRRGSPSTRAT